jgi:hypothetical protein
MFVGAICWLQDGKRITKHYCKNLRFEIANGKKVLDRI